MRLYQQLVLFMLAATVLPLAVVGFLLLSRAEAELTERIGAEQRMLAATTAESVSAELMETVDALARSAELFDWERVSAEEFQGGLPLLYGQSPAVSAVLQLDAEGRPRGAPVFQPEGVGEHPGFDPRAVRTLVEAVPVQSLRRWQQGAGGPGPCLCPRPQRPGGGGGGGEAGGRGGRSLRSRRDRLLRPGGPAGATRGRQPGAHRPGGLLQGRILASSLPERRLKPLEPALFSLLAPGDPQARSFRVEPPPYG